MGFPERGLPEKVRGEPSMGRLCRKKEQTPASVKLQGAVSGQDSMQAADRAVEQCAPDKRFQFKERGTGKWKCLCEGGGGFRRQQGPQLADWTEKVFQAGGRRGGERVGEKYLGTHSAWQKGRRVNHTVTAG